MDCPTEESVIRKVLDRVAGIQSLRFELSARTLEIDGPIEVINQSLVAIRAAGFKPEPITPATSSSGAEKQSVESGEGIPRLICALIFALGAEAISYFWKDGTLSVATGMVLAGIAIWLAGFSTYRKGWFAIRRAKLNMNALMSVAVTGAFLIGQWPEAAMVMALYGIAELIEARAADRARNAIRNLLSLTPDHSDVLQPDGNFKITLVSEIPIGAIIRIRPGERIALDGVVVEGSSAVNQSPVTGESIPVDKSVGDTVFAATINENAELHVRVTAAANDTTLARIIEAVEAAQATRAPTQKFVDRFSEVYTPAVFVLALMVSLVTPWLFNWTWIDALYKGLVLLVIACPCALVISTPVTIVSALASAARRGILIKGGVYLEAARKLRSIALDKTGTITEGKPELVRIEILRSGKDNFLVTSLAASLAARSDHPVSKAITAGLEASLLPVSDFKALKGRGVQGVIDGQMFVLGNHRLIEERKQCDASIESKLKEHESVGRTVTLLASESGVLAIIAVADKIKDSSRSAVDDLKSLGVTPVMLTGDNKLTAKNIAAEAGIDDARGDLLPDDKLTAIEDLKTWRGPIAMVGDGINDAPALARADIGIAMGGAGTDAAMEAADVVIMNDDLRRIPELIRLSRVTRSILVQNITLALSIKGTFLVLALMNQATMWMAVFADMGASLLVVANGLRLIRK